MEKFKTIVEDSVSAELVEKKSKFIANLFFVDSVEDAENKIKEIKKKYYDARHNCSAYIINNNNEITKKSSDDGEPSGTAGAPMISILQKNNLCNILVVVTRYFGGILLGTGGLVRCYSESTLKALESANKITLQKGIEKEILLDYNSFEEFKYYCRKNNINIIETNYYEQIKAKVEMDFKNEEKFCEDIQNKKIEVIQEKTICCKYIQKKKE